MDLNELTVKELQEKLVELGMPKDDVAAFRSKAPLIASITAIQTKSAEYAAKAEAKADEEPPVKRVKTLEETPNPAEERLVDKRWLGKAKAMKEWLMKQTKVKILVPLEPAEKVGVVEWRTGKHGDYQVHISGAIITPQLNGYKYMIPKGRYTDVPMQIAEVVSDAQQQILDAGKEIRADRIDPNTGRPVSEAL